MKKKIVLSLIITLLFLTVVSVPTEASTVSIQGGGRIRTAKNLLISNSKTYVARMTSTKEDHWYKFKTYSSSCFYTITVTNCNYNGYVEYYVTDQYEENLESGYAWKNDSSSINIKLNKSKYYYLHLSVENECSGNVKFNISARKDKEGDTLRTAKEITLGRTVVARIDGDSDNDVDYFKFKPTVSRYYRFVIKNCTCGSYVDAYVLDQYESQMGEGSYWTNDAGSIRKMKLTANKWYYVKIKGYNVGTYKLTVLKQ